MNKIIVLFFMLIVVEAQAASNLWIGSANEYWTNAANWSPTSVPNSNTNLTYFNTSGSTPVRLTNEVDNMITNGGMNINRNGLSLDGRATCKLYLDNPDSAVDVVFNATGSLFLDFDNFDLGIYCLTNVNFVLSASSALTLVRTSGGTYFEAPNVTLTFDALSSTGSFRTERFVISTPVGTNINNFGSVAVYNGILRFARSFNSTNIYLHGAGFDMTSPSATLTVTNGITLASGTNIINAGASTTLVLSNSISGNYPLVISKDAGSTVTNRWIRFDPPTSISESEIVSFEGSSGGLGYGTFYINQTNLFPAVTNLSIDAYTYLYLGKTNLANDGVSVYITSSTTIVDNVAINFVSNYVETIGRLYVDGIPQYQGTWGASGSGATYINDDVFSGLGMINVTEGPTPIARVLTVGGKALVINGKMIEVTQ